MSITRPASGAGVTRQAITRHLREARDCLTLISRQWDHLLARLKASVEDED